MRKLPCTGSTQPRHRLKPAPADYQAKGVHGQSCPMSRPGRTPYPPPKAATPGPLDRRARHLPGSALSGLRLTVITPSQWPQRRRKMIRCQKQKFKQTSSNSVNPKEPHSPGANNAGCRAPATLKIAGFLLCRENCCEQFLKLQIKAVASPRNQSSNVLSQLEPGTFLNKSHPRNQSSNVLSQLEPGTFLNNSQLLRPPLRWSAFGHLADVRNGRSVGLRLTPS